METIECPYCDNEQEVGDWQEVEEEEDIEDECNECGGEFSYKWHSTIHFSTPKRINEKASTTE